MRVKLVSAAKSLPQVGIFWMLLFAPLAAGQTQKRIISWQPHTFGRITAVGEGVRLSSVAAALEIVDFTVEGESVSLGEPFAAGDEWLKSLRVRVRNISGQPITRAQMNFVLPESRADGGRLLGVILQYGSVPAERPKPIPPGEEFELSMREWTYSDLKQKLAERQDSKILNRLFITVTSAHFADGTSWASGCVGATKPKNACPAPAA
jgi:hypothetical protein